MAEETGSLEQKATEQGVDYARLQHLLEAGQWKEADQETLARMCEVIDRQQEGCLRPEDIQNFPFQNFPCNDLSTIDQLWIKHSQGRFGFSVQKQIWQNHGSPTNDDVNWKEFGNSVGWRRNGEWTQETLSDISSAPPGHLPRLDTGAWWDWGYVDTPLTRPAILSRVKACGL